MNKIRTIEKVNEAELNLGISDSASWHAEFAHSPYIYIGGLPFELNEGDIIVVFSQYGVVDAMKLHRDKDTGKSRGYCFLRYQDPRSCVLAVDNFNGATLLTRKISVNHVKEYKNPEEMDIVAERLEDSSSEDEETKREKRHQRKKEKRDESRNLELMRAAMSQNPEERQRAIEKERRKEEKRRHKSEKRQEDEMEKSRAKRPKYEEEEDVSSTSANERHRH
jgi:RNA-binding motif X-linked protein 2